jgi:hypothetical protein
MPVKAATPDSIKKLEKALPDAIERASSREAIVEWVKSRPGVVDASVGAGLLKSEPPQICLVVNLQLDPAVSVTKEIYIDVLPTGKFRLNRIGAN